MISVDVKPHVSFLIVDVVLYWLINRLTDWASKCIIWPMAGLTDVPADWLIDYWLINWLIDCWLINWLTDCIIWWVDGLIEAGRTEEVNEWVSKWLTERANKWSDGWTNCDGVVYLLIDRMHRLTDLSEWTYELTEWVSRYLKSRLTDTVAEW